MNRAWATDIFTALALALLVAGAVLIVGGPVWAAVGFGSLVYLAEPLHRQSAA